MRDNGSFRRQRRHYTSEERVEILREAEEFGAVEAARRHDMPESTVFNWRHHALRREEAVRSELPVAGSPPG